MATREVVSPSAGSEHSLHTMVSPPQPEQMHQQEPSGDSTIVETSSTPKIGDAEAEETPGEGIVSGDEGERPRTPLEGEGKAQESDGAEGWDVVSAREGTSPPKAKVADEKKDGKGGEKKTVTGGKVAEAIKKFATKATTPGSAAKPAPGKLSARSSLARPTAATLNRSTTAKNSTTPAVGSTTTRPGHKSSPSISSVKNGTPLSSSTATAQRTRPAVAPNTTKAPSTTATSTLARRQSVASSATARAPAPSTNGRMTSTSTGTATGKRTPTSSSASSVKPVGALRTTTPPTGAPQRMATKPGSVSVPHRPTVTPFVSATASKPPAPKARSSIAPAAGKVPATTAIRSATGLHGPVKLNTATEGKIRELEEQLERQKVDFGTRESAFQEERKELEERHATEIATIRTELDASSVQASTESAKRIEDLRQTHSAEIDELKEASEVALAELRQALEQTQASLEAALDQCKTLTSQSQDKDREVAELHAAIASAEAGLNGAQEEVTTLREAQSAGSHDVAAARAEVESLRAELHAKAEEVEQLKRTVEESGTSSSGLQEKLHALEEQVAELKSTKAAAEAAWAEERQALSMDLETHVKATAKGKEQLATIEESACAQQTEIERLRIAQTALTDDHDQARRLAEQHAAKIAELNAQLQQTATEHDKLLMEAAQLSDSKVLDLEDRLSEALKEKAEIMERLRQAEERAEKTESELKETLEALTVGEQKIGALEEAVNALQKQLVAQQAEHETKHAAAFDDAKAAAQQVHAAELAAIRSDLAVTHSQLQAAHAAEVDSITAEHATALAAANADHASQMQILQDQQDASSSALADAQAKLEKATTLVTDLTGEVENLEQLVETLKAEAAKVNPSAEAELQRSLREMDGMRDELEGTKLALEMNKSHFQQTLEEMQSQHSKDAAAAAEARAQEATDIRKKNEQAMADLHAEMQHLRAELQDERVAKNTALAQAQQARIKTPPPAVINTPPVSPSHLTKLHEAHNAKVAELEGTIKRLSTELAKRPSTVAIAAIPGEPSVPAPAPRAATPPVIGGAKDAPLADLPPLPPTPAHVHGEGDEDEDVDETF